MNRIQADMELFSIPQLAAHWVGVPDEDMEKVISELSFKCENGFVFCEHASYGAIKPYSMKITEAISMGVLHALGYDFCDPIFIEQENILSACKHGDMILKGDKIRAWLEAKNMPKSEWPPFLLEPVDTGNIDLKEFGYCGLVIEMKLEGKTDKEIAQFLKKKNFPMPQSQYF